MIHAVLFDLDDTLYAQSDWLSGAWESVAAAAPPDVDSATLLVELRAIAAEGSAKGGIIDRALDRVAPGTYAAPLVAAFKAHRSDRLELYPGVRDRLEQLRRYVPIGLVTDGDPVLQRDKVRALDLTNAFDVLTYSDVFGRSCRKPHPLPFETTLGHLEVSAKDAVMVGDRPSKDIDGASRLGMRAIRVLTGEYAADPDQVVPWFSCASAADAIDSLLLEVGARTPV